MGRMSEEIFCTSLRLRLRFVQKISKTINYKKMITFAKLIKTRKYTLFGTLPLRLVSCEQQTGHFFYS